MSDGPQTGAASPRRRWRRLAGLVLVVLVILGGRLFSHRPVAVTLHVVLGPAARGLERLDVDLYPGTDGSGTPAAHSAVTYGPGAAPSEDTLHLSLARGRYRARVRLAYGDHATEIERDLSVEGEGDVYLRV